MRARRSWATERAGASSGSGLPKCAGSAVIRSTAPVRSSAWTKATEAPMTRLVSVGVFVLPPGARLGGLRFGRSLEQEAEVGRHEWVRRRHGVGVEDRAVLAREGDP